MVDEALLKAKEHAEYVLYPTFEALHLWRDYYPLETLTRVEDLANELEIALMNKQSTAKELAIKTKELSNAIKALQV